MNIKFTFESVDYFFRRPTLGNKNELAFQRISRRSRGGDLIIFRDEDWPKTETLSLTFDFLKESDATDFLYFISLTLGSFVYYTDHENRQWLGVIQNPDAECVQAGRYSYQVSIIFEGDQV